MSANLVLAFPSKGRLHDQVRNFLADCGLGLSQDSGARGYAARIEAAPDVEVRLLSAGEIARALHEGEIHVGITGEDLLREIAVDLPKTVLIKPLGFGRADLVVAAPQSWIDVQLMADLDPVCAAYRMRTGRRLRVATKYIALTRAFFERNGLDDYRIVESLGATEGAPAAGAAELIVDITTTGQTLAANHLKPLADGLILKSQAQLAASRAARWGKSELAAFSRLLDAVEARAQAKAMRLLVAPIGKAGPDAILARAEAFGARLAESDHAEAVVRLYAPESKVAALCAALQEVAAGPVAVLRPDYIFESPNKIYECFQSSIAATA